MARCGLWCRSLTRAHSCPLHRAEMNRKRFDPGCRVAVASLFSTRTARPVTTRALTSGALATSLASSAIVCCAPAERTASRQRWPPRAEHGGAHPHPEAPRLAVKRSDLPQLVAFESVLKVTCHRSASLRVIHETFCSQASPRAAAPRRPRRSPRRSSRRAGPGSYRGGTSRAGEPHGACFDT